MAARARADDFVFSAAAPRQMVEPLRRVYAFHGEDDVQKDEAIDLLRRAAVDPGFEDFDLEVMEAASAAPDAILASASTAPLGSPRRLVIVHGAEILRRREKQADADRLARGIGGLGSASCLALRVGASEEERSRGKTVLTGALDAAIREHGLLVACRPLTGEALLRWLEREATDAGKSIEEPAARRLIESARGGRVALISEIEKVICYAGARPAITADMVEAVSSYDAEDVAFQLVDAVSARNADRALRLLHEVLRYDSKPQAVAGRLLALLDRQFRLLWQASELAAMRVTASALRSLPEDIAADLPAEASITSVAWKAGALYGAARQWNRHALGHAFDLLVGCDLANKGGTEGSEDVVTNLELLVLRLCQAR